MAPRRLRRRNWWLLIPLGWVLVGILGHWMVAPMVFLAIFIGGGFTHRPGRSPRLRQRHHDPVAWQPPQQPPVGQVDLTKHRPVPTLSTLAASPGVPEDIRERAKRLDLECASTLTYLREHNAPTTQVLEVEQIQDDFGPQALRSYLALAPGTGETPVLGTKTGHQLVVEQLDLLLAQVAAQLHRAGRIGSDELLANHRFLTDKFGHRGDSELTL